MGFLENNCTDCGGKIGNSASVCPHCGAKAESMWRKTVNSIYAIIFLFVLLMVGGFIYCELLNKCT